MNNLESGLLLPIRFYNTLEEQDRYKNHALGVALNEKTYPYVDCASLAPFQITWETRDYTYYANNQLILICVDRGTETALPYNHLHWQEYVGTGDTHYHSYMGTDDFSAFTFNGLFYLEFRCTFTPTMEFRIFYSDLFMIANCDETGYDIEDYRIWSSGANYRSVDATDLRIT